MYNAERYLAETLASIKAQTFTDFQVLAVLDAPTDRSEEILRQHADARFDILRNDRNLGVGHTTQLILERTESAYLARMDSDDLMEPRRIERELAFLGQHPDIDVVGTYFDEIDEEGRKVREAVAFPTNPELIRQTFRQFSVLHHPTVMYRTARIRAVGGYDPRINYSEDIWLWLKCLAQGYRFAILPEVLHHYRVHRQQLMWRRLEPTLRSIDRAYFTYGPQIWGNRAPDYVAGYTRWHRLRRRVRRIFHDWRKD